MSADEVGPPDIADGDYDGFEEAPNDNDGVHAMSADEAVPPDIADGDYDGIEEVPHDNDGLDDEMALLAQTEPMRDESPDAYAVLREELPVDETPPLAETPILDFDFVASAAPPGGLGLQPQPPASARSTSGTQSPIYSKARWHQSTKQNLANAKALKKQALHNLLEEDTKCPNGKILSISETSKQVKSTITKKIAATEDLTKALEDRIASVEDSIRQVGECLFQLQRAHRTKWAPLNVCEQRLELREGRPVQERISDQCQEALVAERRTLIESRQELSDNAGSMKEILIVLDKIKNELLEDLRTKRHGLRIDRFCLSPRKPISVLSGRRPQDHHHNRLVLPSLMDVMHYEQAPSPKNAEVGTGHVHEESRITDTRALLARAVKAEESGIRLCNESDASMAHTKRECDRAGAQSQAALQHRIHETSSLSKELQDQIEETSDTLQQTEMALTRMRKKLDLHDQPLRGLDAQFDARGKRRGNEGIRDHVHEQMEDHLDTLKKSVKSLSNRCQATKDILDQLKESKEQMQEDLRCKTIAKTIDDQCMKVTPRKALELNRSDPRGGRCRQPSNRKNVQRQQMNLQTSVSFLPDDPF